ncbi:MAG: DNA-directed RNA polymerase subunit alpha [Thermodesulfovibrionales bacterium]|nr:DNA-directed RNA polymerase subunit alpha [Thermodesulfovibrionales bacterium]
MDLRKKGFQMPEKIHLEEDTLTDTYGKLIAEPLERGFGTTLGGALRRVLLSSIEGAAATGIRIEGAVHEFATIEGVKEDVVDITLNIKNLKFRMEGSSEKTAILKATGPKEITGADLQVDASLTVMNPDQHILTLDKGVEFGAEIYVEKGVGYRISESQDVSEKSVDVIALDSVFSPVIKANFTVEKARVGRSTDYDRLVLEVWTDGSVTPKAAISYAASIMNEHLDFFVFEREAEEAVAVDQVDAVSEDVLAMNPNLLKSVDELELSVRAHNCLKNAEIKSIADLVQRTEYDMLRTKNFGRKSLNEIKEILGTMGLNFGMRIDMNTIEDMGEVEPDEA